MPFDENGVLVLEGSLDDLLDEKKEGRAQDWKSVALRTAGPVLGGIVGGIPGAMAGAGLATALDKARLGEEDMVDTETVTDAALAAVPGGALVRFLRAGASPAARLAARGVQGAIEAASSQAGYNVAHGEQAGENLLTAAALGGAGSVALEKLLRRAGKAASPYDKIKPEPMRDPDLQAARMAAGMPVEPMRGSSANLPSVRTSTAREHLDGFRYYGQTEAPEARPGANTTLLEGPSGLAVRQNTLPVDPRPRMNDAILEGEYELQRQITPQTRQLLEGPRGLAVRQNTLPVDPRPRMNDAIREGEYESQRAITQQTRPLLEGPSPGTKKPRRKARATADEDVRVVTPEELEEMDSAIRLIDLVRTRQPKATTGLAKEQREIGESILASLLRNESGQASTALMQSVAGGALGGMGGAMLPADSSGERLTNTLAGAGAGAITPFALRRLLRQRETGVGTSPARLESAPSRKIEVQKASPQAASAPITPEIKPDFTGVSNMTQPVFSFEANNKVRDAALAFMRKHPERLAELQYTGEKGDTFVDKLLPHLDLDEETKRQYREGFAFSGQMLQGQRVMTDMLVKQADELAKTDPQLAEKIKRTIRRQPDDDPGWWNRAWQWTDDTSRALIVSNLSTTTGNILNQGARSVVHAFDQAFQTVLKGGSLGDAWADGWETFAALGRNFTKGRFRAIRDLSRVDERARGLNAGDVPGISEGTLGSLTGKLNFANRLQEQYFRNAIFDATLTTMMRQRGLDPAQAISAPKTIPDDIMKQAVHHALEVTAALPVQSKWGQAVMTAYRHIPFGPVLSAIMPFPRFFAQSMRDLANFSPAGLLYHAPEISKFFRAGASQAEINEGVKHLSRGLIGTTLLGAAFAARQAAGGEKWYELEYDGKTYDMRKYAPFSTYMFFAEAVLQQAGVSDRGMTTQDAIQGFLASNRLAGSGLAIVDLAQGGSADSWWANVQRLVGEYIGRFTVPFKQLSDVSGALGYAAGADDVPEDVRVRTNRGDSAYERLVWPGMRNIPGVQRAVPEARSPLREGPIGTENPALRQATSLTYKTKTPLEKEVDRLALGPDVIYPRSGNAEFDRLVVNEMGRLSEQIAGRFIASEQYQRANDGMRRYMLQEVLKEVRAAATELATARDPRLRQRATLEGRQKRLVEFLAASRGQDPDEYRESLLE